jgi:hypothetical protein
MPASRPQITLFHVLWFTASAGTAWCVYFAARDTSLIARILYSLGAFVVAVVCVHFLIVVIVIFWIIPRLKPESHWNREVDSYMAWLFPGKW